MAEFNKSMPITIWIDKGEGSCFGLQQLPCDSVSRLQQFPYDSVSKLLNDAHTIKKIFGEQQSRNPFGYPKMMLRSSFSEEDSDSFDAMIFIGENALPCPGASDDDQLWRSVSFDMLIKYLDALPEAPETPIPEVKESTPAPSSHEDMINYKTWEEFRDSGFLWLVNSFLQLFGWTIVIDMKRHCAYPARTKFRGFLQSTNDEGYFKVTKFMADHAKDLLAECDPLIIHDDDDD